MENIKFIIIMATYYRNDGKTYNYIHRSLDSILSQTFTYWDLIIVGDKYEPSCEIIEIIEKYKNKTKNNIFFIQNLDVERDKINDKKKLWKCAGARSMNLGLKIAREKGYKYYAHLDDDDFWKPNHLELIAKVYNDYPNCAVAFTKSTFLNRTLPRLFTKIRENNCPVKGSTIIHSALSFRIDLNDLTYSTEGILPSDHLLLENLNIFLKNSGYSSVYIPVLTCYHDVEAEYIN